VTFVHEVFGLSISRGCAALQLSRTTFMYKPVPRDDMPLIAVLLELVDRYPRC